VPINDIQPNPVLPSVNLTLAQAIRTVWLGPRAVPAGNAMYKYDDLSAQPGRWRFYEGSPEHILRRTFARALEVSLGIEPGTNAPGTRRWPVMLMWKCAQPWLEGWVQWRSTSNGGAVSVVICTPGDGNHISLDPRAGQRGLPVRPVPATDVVLQEPPLEANGSVVVTHDKHKISTYRARSTTSTLRTSLTTGVGVTTKAPYTGAPLPIFGGDYSYVNVDVIVVSPRYVDGGVAPVVK
jgi:hypothetical protein